MKLHLDFDGSDSSFSLSHFTSSEQVYVLKRCWIPFETWQRITIEKKLVTLYIAPLRPGPDAGSLAFSTKLDWIRPSSKEEFCFFQGLAKF